MDNLLQKLMLGGSTAALIAVAPFGVAHAQDAAGAAPSNDVEQGEGPRILRRHVDLNLVALLVTLYDFVILLVTCWLAILPRPVLLVSSYIVTVVAIVLAVVSAWAWLRSRRTVS